MSHLLLPLLALLIQDAPAPQATPTATPAVPEGPAVVLNTSVGKIKLVLNREKAPITVDNFLKYVRAGHYDGTIFHRVMPRFMIQGGGFEADMTQRTQTLRPPIRNEARNGLRNLRGTIAMARTNDPNSATAQFFINVVDNPSLDFGIRGAGYAVFGEVVEGMEVADKIAGVPTGNKSGHQNVPAVPITLISARELPKAAPKTP
jgi:peptidyl-prolyl cis-trans isomerase A (cyclophilin A)